MKEYQNFPNTDDQSGAEKPDGFEGWELDRFSRDSRFYEPEDLNSPKGRHLKKLLGTYGTEYQSEVRRIVEKYGNLEEIRSKLNLSRRQICRILLVDPSAWTRWLKKGEPAPPHIYRSLELILEKSLNSDLSTGLSTLDAELGARRFEKTNLETKRSLKDLISGLKLEGAASDRLLQKQILEIADMISKSSDANGRLKRWVYLNWILLGILLSIGIVFLAGR